LTNLHKYIKNKKVIVENEEPKDTDMQEATVKKERSSRVQTCLCFEKKGAMISKL
jgi:hypothetical protein